MKQENIKGKTNDIITEMKIKAFHQLHKNKGMTLGYVEMLFNKGLNEVVDDIAFCKDLNEFSNKISMNFDSYTRKAVFPSIISGFLFGIFNGNDDVYFSESQNKLLLSNNFNSVSTRRFLEQYKTIIYEYIKNDSALANSILQSNIGYNPNIKLELQQNHIDNLISQLFIDRTNFNITQRENLRVVLKLVLEMQVLYSPNILFNNIEFVKFEMKNGYFRKYISSLNINQKIPTIQERIDSYEIQKEMSSEEKTQLDNLSLLEERVSRLGLQYRQNLYSILKQAKLEPDNRKRIELTDDCYSMYEIAFRREIVDNLYSPQMPTEITKYIDLRNLLIHMFIKDNSNALDGYEQKLKQQVIAARINGDKSQTLTKQEQEIIDRRMSYAKTIQVNSNNIEDLLNDKSSISNNGIVGNNNNNQITTTFLSPEMLINQTTCIGVGFDKYGLTPDNIALSSSNKPNDINRNNIDSQKMFEFFSSPLSELKLAKKSEIVLFKQGPNLPTKVSYVFAILSGNKIYDDQAILEARKLATTNNLKLILFNLPEIKRSLGMVTQQRPF